MDNSAWNKIVTNAPITLRQRWPRWPDLLPLGCMCKPREEMLCKDPNCPRQMLSDRKYSGISSNR